MANLTKMRREKTQINKIRHKKGEITTNTKEIIEDLCSNKLENLEEMDKFLDTYDHPKQNQKDINNLNRYVIHNEIEAAIVFKQKRKVLDLMDSPLISTRPLRKN
jgi:hypothetical protein